MVCDAGGVGDRPHHNQQLGGTDRRHGPVSSQKPYSRSCPEDHNIATGLFTFQPI